MEFELWYLVALPLVFAAGWFGRGFESKARASDNAALPRSYFRGLNLLLNDKPDTAIDAFIEVVKLDPETIELHHALGNLFRRRGEFDRAVRVHTHLLNRSDLPARERAMALAALGQDYLKGGLLDRAEEAFNRLLEFPDHRFESLRSLLRIYQTEREWLKAIDCARLLEREAGESHQVAVSHFYCELADKALAEGALDRAQQLVDDALAAHRRSPRALILAGDVAARAGSIADALRLWRKVETASLEHLPLIADRIAGAMDSQGERAEAVNWLRRTLLDAPSLDLLDVASRRVAEWQGAPAAEMLVSAELQRHPSLLGLERVVAARLAVNKDDTELQLLASVLKEHARRLARYRCTQCGFRAKEFNWNCPGCNSWDSYPPRRIEELDV